MQIAAKLLLVNINIETSKEYASGAKVADQAANFDYIPPSLLVFIVFLLLLLQGKKELEVTIASLYNLRLYCKQQGQRSSSHPFRLDLVLRCTT